MRKTYGNTWWGQQWLNALSNIDFSNRLPRGRTYANKGAVQEVEISGNSIRALVAGSRPRPYTVEFTVPRFKAAEKARIIELIADNALFLSQLLNRELPPALNKACLEEGIQIFPASWGDIQGHCSCPDWAVPCKHMAAVLYLAANEIDKNPFLVFGLHGFDLLKGLEGIGYEIAGEHDIYITPFQELIRKKPFALPSFEWSADFFESLDFSELPLMREDLLQLLSPQPVFYPAGDFRKLLDRAYRESSKLGRGADAEPAERHQLALERIETVQLRVDEVGAFLEARFYDSDWALLFHFQELGALCDWLAPVPTAAIPHFSNPFRGLLLSFRLAVKLVVNSACVPELLAYGDGSYRVRWLPAYLNARVWELAEAVETLTPYSLLAYQIEEAEYHPTEADDFPALLSLFISHYFKGLHHRSLPFWEQPILRLFFRGERLRFDAFEEQQHPEAIQLWINRFFLAERGQVPVLKVSEAQAGFQVEIAVEDRRQPFSPPVSLQRVLEQEAYQKTRLPVLRNLAMLAHHFPALSQLVASGGKEELYFDNEAFVDVFFSALPAMQLFGIKVLLPKSLQKLLRPQLSMALEGAEDGKVSLSSVISLDRLLQFKWQVALGEQLVDPAEFLERAKKLKGIVKLQDQYIYFEQRALQQLKKKLEAPPTVKPQELLKAALTEDYDGAPVKLDKKAQRLLKRLLSREGAEVPAGLQANLRPYQVRGYEWLYKNARMGFGSLIADDMGLGKTLQVIAALLKLKEEGSLGPQKALVVLPTTLLTNWEKEIQRFAPALKTAVFHGPNRKLQDTVAADVVLTTYGIARSEIAKLKKQPWLCLILDESQNIKNPAAAQAKAVKQLPAPVRIAMSGTPVENRLSEYWSVFDFTNKGYLGSLKQFKEQYAKPIEIDRNQQRLERFRKITAPFILRRLKTDKSIIKDLPEKIEQNQYCQLTPGQAALYQSVLDNTLDTIEQADGIKRRGLILKLITALKQVCNHPRQFLKKGKSDPSLSGKSQQLLQLLTPILDNGDKAILFTQYRAMGDLMAEMVQNALGVEVPFLHGGCSRKQRDAMVGDFQSNRAAHLMILSLKAGGTGLNLTAASSVIHYDLWWNPAVEAQATDRAYRIGQERNVLVHRFITEATFEEKIDQLLKSKKELADLAVSTGEKWIGELSDQELRSLVALEK